MILAVVYLQADTFFYSVCKNLLSDETTFLLI